MPIIEPIVLSEEVESLFFCLLEVVLVVLIKVFFLVLDVYVLFVVMVVFSLISFVVSTISQLPSSFSAFGL